MLDFYNRLSHLLSEHTEATVLPVGETPRVFCALQGISVSRATTVYAIGNYDRLELHALEKILHAVQPGMMLGAVLAMVLHTAFQFA